MAEDGGGQVQAAASEVDPSHPVMAYLGLMLAQMDNFYTMYRSVAAEKQSCGPSSETQIHLHANQVINMRSGSLSFDARSWIAQRSHSHDHMLDFTVRLPESGGKMVQQIKADSGGALLQDINDFWLIRNILEMTMSPGEYEKQGLDEGNQIRAADCAYEQGFQDRQGKPLTRRQKALYRDSNISHYYGGVHQIGANSCKNAYRKRFGVRDSLGQDYPKNQTDIPDADYDEVLNFDDGSTRKRSYPQDRSARLGDANVTPYVTPQPGNDDEGACLMPAYSQGTRNPWEEMPGDAIYQQGCEGYPRLGYEKLGVGIDAQPPRHDIHGQHEGTFKVTNLYGIFTGMYPAIVDVSMFNNITLYIRFRGPECCSVSRVRDCLQFQTTSLSTLTNDNGGGTSTTHDQAPYVNKTSNMLESPLESHDQNTYPALNADYYTQDAPTTAGTGTQVNDGDAASTVTRTLHYAFGNDNLFCDPGSLEDTVHAASHRPFYEHWITDRQPVAGTTGGYKKDRLREYPPSPTFEVFNIHFNYETVSMDSPLYTKQIEDLQQSGALEYQFYNYRTHTTQHQRESTTQDHSQCLTRIYTVMQPPEHDLPAPPIQMKDNPGDKTTGHMPPTMNRSHRFSNMNIHSWQHEVNGTKFPEFEVRPTDTWHLFYDGTAVNSSLVRGLTDFLDYKFVQTTRLSFPHGSARSLDGLDTRGISTNIRLITHCNGGNFMEPVDPSGITPQKIRALHLFDGLISLNGNSQPTKYSTALLKAPAPRRMNPQDQLWRYGEFYARKPTQETIATNDAGQEDELNAYNKYLTDAGQRDAHQPLSALHDTFADNESIMKGAFVKPVVYPNGCIVRFVFEKKSTIRVGTGRQVQPIP